MHHKPLAGSGQTPVFSSSESFKLFSGATLAGFDLAYQTYGTLNAQANNAVLVCHPLTGDQFVGGTHPSTGKDGWWSHMIGPDRPIDTNRWFVICSNVLGGCMGSSGPQQTGLDFPLITISDMVRAQKQLVNALGITQLVAVLGGSMGGMQALQWGRLFPDAAGAIIALACAMRQSAQNIAFHEVGRQAIMADPHWCHGNYIAQGCRPDKGLALARMTAHITYLSEGALHRKFGRNLQNRHNFSFALSPDFQVESYLHHQGAAFIERFDANSYLYITRAVDYFDLPNDALGMTNFIFSGVKARFCILSYSSDWMYPPSEGRAIVRALNAVAADVGYIEVETDKGHDAFLLDEDVTPRAIRGFLEAVSTSMGVP